MRMQCMRQHRFLRSWLGAVLLSALALCVGVSRADAPGRHYRVAVFTTGLTASPVLAGLQEGLAQLGYVEGKTLPCWWRIRMEWCPTSSSAPRGLWRPSPMCL